MDCAERSSVERIRQSRFLAIGQKELFLGLIHRRTTNSIVIVNNPVGRLNYTCPFRETHLHAGVVTRHAGVFPTQETRDAEALAGCEAGSVLAWGAETVLRQWAGGSGVLPE
jgi:hypothetical protein